MMTAGINESAIALAKQRWAAIHPFDLEPELWEQLFSEHRAGDILQAIRKTATTRDRQPALLYKSLLYWLAIMGKQRVVPSWPPADVIQKH